MREDLDSIRNRRVNPSNRETREQRLFENPKSLLGRDRGAQPFAALGLVKARAGRTGREHGAGLFEIGPHLAGELAVGVEILP